MADQDKSMNTQKVGDGIAPGGVDESYIHLPLLKNKITLPALAKKYEAISVPSPEALMQQEIMDNCAIKTAMSGAMGGILGIAFGIFTASLETGGGMDVISDVDKPLRAVLKEQFLNMKAKAWSYSKGFAMMGAVYSGCECIVEKYRGKHDIWNSSYGGCATGAILAYNGGAKAMCFGCLGMGAFSTAIDWFMDTH
jgi:import inner membrane translocase subunit TIM22